MVAQIFPDPTTRSSDGQFQGFRHGCFEIRIVTVDFKVNAAIKAGHAGGGRNDGVFLHVHVKGVPGLGSGTGKRQTAGVVGQTYYSKNFRKVESGENQSRM